MGRRRRAPPPLSSTARTHAADIHGFCGGVAGDAANIKQAGKEPKRLEVAATRAAGEQVRVAERQGFSSPAEEAPPEGEGEPPDDFICPITTEIMSDPVMTADAEGGCRGCRV